MTTASPWSVTAVPWRFWIDDAWTVAVSAAPGEEHRSAFFDAAVPALAARARPAVHGPLIIVGHVTAPGRRPGGPAGRAKVFLDALHDDRKSGPEYRDLGVPPPVPDDTPRHVGGLALEVHPGSPEIRYLIGARLRVAGQLLAEVPVMCAAPNDIAGTSGEQARIAAARLAFGQTVRTAFTRHGLPHASEVGAVVVRHHPQRDEDNTWHTWITAICSASSNPGVRHWADGAPLAGWRPTAVASIADTTISSPVQYELWG